MLKTIDWHSLEPNLTGSFSEYLDFSLAHGDGQAQLGVDQLANKRNTLGAVHGGIIAALVDIAGSLACVDDVAHEAGITISLTIHYMQPVMGESIKVSARRSGGGRRLRFATIELFDEKSDAPRAYATGSFKIHKREGG